MQEVNLGAKDIDKINETIKSDTQFLAGCNIMDYSVLLGIESKVQVDTEYRSRTFSDATRKGTMFSGTELARFKRHRFTSPDGNQTYHLSIIDFLQCRCNWYAAMKQQLIHIGLAIICKGFFMGSLIKIMFLLNAPARAV